ncbi:MAG: AzlD domain-containing protein [Afipia sp.]|nr:AzlD domain-containing protein [Afipia sp.]
MTIFGDAHALALLVFAGFLPNEVWRFLGFVVGRRVHEDSEILVWVRAVSAAILAGVIAQILIAPPGALAAVPAFVRFGSTVIGFTVYLAARKSVFVGVIVGEICVLAGKWWFG